MKKQLLFSSLLLLGVSNIKAQVTQADLPTTGTSTTMFVVDSFASNFSTAVGASQVWDYANLFGYTGQTLDVAYETAGSQPSSTDFPNASSALVIPTFLTRFLNPTAGSLASEGFIYSDDAIGEIKVILDANNQTVMNYPFAFNAITTDNFAGDVSGGPLVVPAPCTGNSTTTYDGTGTLKLNGIDISNVYRIKQDLTANANLGLLGDVVLNNVQYEYYNIATSKLPLFIHTTLSLSISGGAPMSQSLVLTSVEPVGYLGTEENTFEFSMFPNPAVGDVTIAGLTGNSTITVYNTSGQVVKQITSNEAFAQFNIENLSKGIYTVEVSTDKGANVQRLAVK